MKRILMPLLLTFSVGLNIGLGASLLRDQRSSSNAALEAACQICSDACQRVAGRCDHH